MTETPLHVEWPEPGICLLSMNRPASHNALSRALLVEMIVAVEAAPTQGAKVLILTGNGPSFCAGADLKERRSLDDDAKFAHNRQINALAAALAAAPICTIAVMGGPALGGGLEIALACDLRFAATTVKLGLTEARLGAIPGAGGTQRLPRLIGASRALQMIFAGEPINAQQAAEWGLVNGIFEADHLMGHVLGYARLVASRSPNAAAELKRVVAAGLDTSLAAGLDLECAAIERILKSADYQEGLSAFAEKRAPKFG